MVCPLVPEIINSLSAWIISTYRRTNHAVTISKTIPILVGTFMEEVVVWQLIDFGTVGQ